MDTILDDYTPPEVLVKYFPGGHCGYDLEGAPIWIAPSGKLDIRGMHFWDIPPRVSSN